MTRHKSLMMSLGRVHEESADVPGWRRVHVREEPQKPLGPFSVTVAELRRTVAPNSATRRVAFTGSSGVVVDGFAFVMIDRTVVYGLGDDHVSIAGIDWRRPPAPQFVSRLAGLVRAHDLLLIHWPRGQVAASESDIAGLLR